MIKLFKAVARWLARRDLTKRVKKAEQSAVAVGKTPFYPHEVRSETAGEEKDLFEIFAVIDDVVDVKRNPDAAAKPHVASHVAVQKIRFYAYWKLPPGGNTLDWTKGADTPSALADSLVQTYCDLRKGQPERQQSFIFHGEGSEATARKKRGDKISVLSIAQQAEFQMALGLAYQRHIIEMKRPLAEPDSWSL